MDIKPGDFLLSVNGKPVSVDAEVYREFEGTVGKRVELKVGPRADGSLARTVVVEPIADEGALRNRAWVERNLRLVQERTGGRVAYVYVPNTAGAGYSYFKRYFFPQADKAAIIVDERNIQGRRSPPEPAVSSMIMTLGPRMAAFGVRIGSP